MRTIDQSCLLSLVLLAVGCGAPCQAPWYADADGDGYGDRSDLVQACAPPDGYVDDASDCDDRDAAVHPEAVDTCNGVDDDCDGTPDPEAREWYADLDEDGLGGRFTATACSAPSGYVATIGDCDDGDPSVYPGAVEQCDGRDQDCDGLVDDGVGSGTFWYPDDDGDGWGLTSAGRDLCNPPESWIDRAGDCDDGDGAISPLGFELCNGIDDDCDGAVDLDDSDVLASAVFRDGDGDGWGAGQPSLSCGPIPGWAPTFADCDDTDPSASPSGIEICGGRDEDCDGLVDEDDPSLDPASLLAGWSDLDGDGLGDPDAPTAACAVGQGLAANDLDCDDTDPGIGTDDWLADADGDGAGAGTPEAGDDCRPPSPGMTNTAGPVDCDDGDPTVREGAPDFCGDGVDQDCTGIDPACTGPLPGIVAIEDAGRAWITGRTNGDALGVVSAGADFDGDGFPDVLVGAPGAGSVQILWGPPPEGAAWTGGTEIVGAPGSRLGAAFAGIADVAGDGRPDLLVGAPLAGGGGEVTWVTGDDGWTLPWLTVTGLAGDEVGASVADVGDLDGDGVGAVLIGAPGRSEVAILLPAPGILAFDASPLRLQSAGGRLGEQVACCTDVTGAPSLVIADPADGTGGIDAGGVWLVDAGFPAGTLDVLFAASGHYTGAPGAHLGRAVATGDIDGDGSRDVLTASPSDPAGGPDAGRVHGFTTLGFGAAADLATWTVEGEFAGMGLASAIAVGDVDGDGAPDVVLGAADVDIGGADGGAVYLFYGPMVGTDRASDADAVLYGPVGSAAGATVAVGEIDVDAGADLWIGLPGVSPGAAWLVPGP